MTIKKRLFWSNILMILVPVISAALVGVLCIGFLWLALVNRAGLGGLEWLRHITETRAAARAGA